MRRFLLTSGLAVFVCAATRSACLPLPRGAQNVTAADLHQDGLPPETVLSLAPAPGSQRIFHFPELKQIAARFHLPEFTEEICVERRMGPLDRGAALDAMQKEIPEAKIEIIETSLQPAPEGDLVFRRAGLRPGSTGAVWYGGVRYAPNREFTIWAKVRVSVELARVVAMTALSPGRPIEASQVKVGTIADFPSQAPLATTLEETVGRYPRVPISAGSSIRRDALEPPQDVHQGETVKVEVASGNARLRFEGRAAASGAIGATIPVVNPASSKRFQARVESKGKVLVEAR